jgi:membrane-associated phospholipid phosphatase
MLKKKIARIISELSNGYLTMILTPVIALCISNIDTFSKLTLSLGYLLSSILPYFVLKAFGRVSDYEFTKREERPPYFTTISILYGIIFLYTLTLGNELVSTITLNIFVVTTVMTTITYFWKISGHMTYSTLLFVTLIFLFPSNPYLYLLFLFTPFIGWSRIELEKHTLSQVTLGTFLTILISILIYYPFW